MNRLLAIALATTVTIGGVSAASARDGCGRGYFRGPAGHCRPMHAGPGYVVRPVIGTFYPGRGYYYNTRYWQHRYRHHNGWRYR